MIRSMTMKSSVSTEYIGWFKVKKNTKIMDFYTQNQ